MQVGQRANVWSRHGGFEFFNGARNDTFMLTRSLIVAEAVNCWSAMFKIEELRKAAGN